MNGDENLPEEKKIEVLTLLQTEINTANKLTGRIIRLFAGFEDQPCGDRQMLMESIIEGVGTIMSIEEAFISIQSRM